MTPEEAEELIRNGSGLTNDHEKLCYALGWLRAMPKDPEGSDWKYHIRGLPELIDDGRGLKR